jgi:hypothetical protein
MKAKYSLWLGSACASVLMFVGQKLETLGKVIASEMERPYAGAEAQILSVGRKPVERKRTKCSKLEPRQERAGQGL